MKKYISQPPNFIYTFRDYLNVIKEMHSISNWKKEEKYDLREKFEEEFEKYIGTNYALSVNSGNVALDLATECLDLQPDDEVIVPAINFYGTQLSILRKTNKLIFCKVDDTLRIDINDLLAKITTKTKAIYITHMNGIPTNIEEIKEKLKQFDHKIYIVEDVARSLGATYNGKKCGTFGDIGIFSFQQKKNFCTLGEGGMIVTNNKMFYDKIKKIRSFGHQKEWGTNFRMTRVQCSLGISQIKNIDKLNIKRRKVAIERNSMFRKNRIDFKLPEYEREALPIYTYYTLILPPYFTDKYRDLLRIKLEEEYGIQTCIANEPTYKTHKYIFDMVGNQGNIDLDLGNRIINLPIHYNMTTKDNKYITTSFMKVYKQVSQIAQTEFIKNSIIKDYKINAKHIKVLNKGYTCDKWIIDDRYVLKELEFTDFKRLKLFLDKSIDLIKNGLTPKIIKTKDGKYFINNNGRYYILFDKINIIDKKETIEEYARFLYEVHKSLNERISEKISKYKIEKPKTDEIQKLLNNKDLPRLIRKALILKLKYLKNYILDLKKMNKSYIHGDYYLDNILNDGIKNTIIDLDDISYFYCFYDVVRGAMKFGFNQKNRLDNICNFISEYLFVSQTEDDYIEGIKLYIYMQLNDLYGLNKNIYTNNYEFIKEKYKQTKWLVKNEKKLIRKVGKKYESKISSSDYSI